MTSPQRLFQAALNFVSSPSYSFTRVPQSNRDLELNNYDQSCLKRVNSRLVVRVALGALVIGAIIRFTLLHPPDRLEEEKATFAVHSSGGFVLDPSFYVNGPLSSKFRDNLRPEFKYITAFSYGGFTNDYMVWCNMIYLAVLSRRIPILGPLLPMSLHIGEGGTTLNFGDVFDLPRLSEAIQTPILQWSDVKKARYGEPLDWNKEDTTSGGEMDYIGCWSLWPTINKKEHEPHGSDLPWFLKLGIVWTQAPSWIKLFKDDDFTVSLSALAKMLFPEGRMQAIHSPEGMKTPVMYDDIPENIASQLYPDEHLACFDILYWVGVSDKYEWEKHSHPAWDLVGTNLHFTQRVEDIANEYLRKLFNIGVNGTEIPPYISVHVRRSDFLSQCGTVKMVDCVAPMSAYVRRVKQVQDELAAIHGPHSRLAKGLRVVVTSDEQYPKWWEEVRDLGWLGMGQFDREIGTKYGRWYPTIIDAVIQSRGKAFVGTQGSTMSDYAARRVQDWQNGPWKLVRWRYKDADLDYSGDFAKRHFTS